MTLPENYTSGFNRKSTAQHVTEGVDLTGKTILVTGVGSGLGKECVDVLSRRGAHVIGLDRTLAAAQHGCDAASGKTTAIECDLSDPKSIIACAKAVKKQVKVLDVILTNAGVMAPPYTVVNGYSEPLELQFAVNFMGHFLLINHLMPLVEAAPSARLAIVASEGYAAAPKKEGILFDNLDYSEKYDALTAYGHSKLAVMLLRLELAKRVAGTSVTANSIHPGVIRTNLASDSTSWKVKLISAFAGPWTRTVSQGAATHCFVAANPALDGVNGLHFADSNPKEPKDHPRVADAALAAQLWAKAEELAADYLFKA